MKSNSEPPERLKQYTDMKSKLIQAISKPETHSHKAIRLSKRRHVRRLSTMNEENEVLYEVLQNFGDWDFNTLGIIDYTSQPLYEVGRYIFSTLELAKLSEIPCLELQNFLKEVELKYQVKNFYHNSVHAADVTSSSMFLLKNGLSMCGELLVLDIFSLIVSSLCHDIAHPGVNNAFLIATKNQLAIKYNDQSVLENMHSSLTFKILGQDNCNILKGLTPEDHSLFRKSTIAIILATDLQKHFVKFNEFRVYLENEELPDFQNDEFRILCLQVIIKCADLGHGAKQLDLHRKWSELIIKEFFAQGDKQRALGMDVDVLFDRNRNHIPESQSGFLNFLVRPIFDVYERFVARYHDGELELSICRRNIDENIAFWESEKGRVERGAQTFFLSEDLPPMMEMKGIIKE